PRAAEIDPGPGGPPDARYRRFLAAGQLAIQRCRACARHIFYPRSLCPACGGGELAWVAPAGTGAVYSTTIVRRKPEQGGDYNVVLVDLDEGVRMMSRVVGLAPEAVTIGLRVRAEIAREGDAPILLFRPEEAP
ncbi:Zn-ribbon domain-containing OB-fold protein, partial [Propylenella binzhouense]|uniref:Zn-ribbon domain-containing OB-fold protein n=1 Tax=Propylenella binzhouense TaxID=2555902 RepID=UPI0019682646